MTTTNDRQVLEDFEAWRERKATSELDMSAAAFLKERKAEEDAWRIDDAITQLNLFIGKFDDLEVEGDELAESMLDALYQTRNILAGDRELIDDRTLTDPTVRTYPA